MQRSYLDELRDAMCGEASFERQVGTEMTNGYMGKLLWVDLASGQIRSEALDAQLARDFIGGYGLGARIIYSHQRAGIDPLAPESILGILTGPCTGTPAIGGTRFMVVGKSPLTGTWGDSEGGGFFGEGLKRAGFDGVFFTGQSAAPVYLLVENGRADLRDAHHLWGKDTRETEQILKAEFGRKAQVVCIGPAGERLSLISGLIHDGGRAAARSGLGALTGSKRLKAVVALGEEKRVPIADEKRFKALRDSLQAQLRLSEGARSLRTYGTAGGLAQAAELNNAPIKNWSGVGPLDFPTAEKISDREITRYEARKYACSRCSVACGGHTRVENGPYAADGHKPEYETLAALGTMPLNDNPESIIYLNDLCNRAGLDTISTGTVCAFAIECYEQGLITSRDADGLELHWGNAEAMVALVEKMIRREGIGDLLADGVKKASERLGRGSEAYAVHCAGQEPGMHDPKYLRGLGIAFQLDATPGRHGQGGHSLGGLSREWKAELGIEAMSAGPADSGYAGMGDAYKRAACAVHFINAAGLCKFPWYCTNPASAWEYVSAVTGWPIDRAEALRIGERIANIRQAFNVREGFNALEHPLHPRLVGTPPLEEGTLKGITVDMDTLLRDFLEAMGWDALDARPRRQTLVELGLQDVERDLW